MQHLDEAQDAVRRYGAHKFEVKQNFDAINHHFDKLNDWYRKLAMKSAQGMELFNKEYPEITAKINKLLGFDECGFDECGFDECGFEYLEKDKEKRNE